MKLSEIEKVRSSLLEIERECERLDGGKEAERLVIDLIRFIDPAIEKIKKGVENGR